MGVLLFKVKLNTEPVTWGTDDAKKRTKIRELIRKQIPQFSEQYIEHLIKDFAEISIGLNCYLIDPIAKDIDNLAKIPIDAIFFAAQNERGYREWESKITSLTVKKIKSRENALEIILYGTT
jgi:Holliday junction resolvase RusA-like endonuclease